MKKYLIRLLILTVIAVVIILGGHKLMELPVSNWTWFSVVFFFSMNMLIQFLSQTSLKGTQKSFVTFVYGSTGLRFIFSIFFIVIYLIISDVMDKFVIGSFLFLYLLYTSFELYHLVSKLRAEK